MNRAVCSAVSFRYRSPAIPGPDLVLAGSLRPEYGRHGQARYALPSPAAAGVRSLPIEGPRRATEAACCVPRPETSLAWPRSAQRPWRSILHCRCRFSFYPELPARAPAPGGQAVVLVPEVGPVRLSSTTEVPRIGRGLSPWRPSPFWGRSLPIWRPSPWQRYLRPFPTRQLVRHQSRISQPTVS